MWLLEFCPTSISVYEKLICFNCNISLPLSILLSLLLFSLSLPFLFLYGHPLQVYLSWRLNQFFDIIWLASTYRLWYQFSGKVVLRQAFVLKAFILYWKMSFVISLVSSKLTWLFLCLLLNFLYSLTPLLSKSILPRRVRGW